FDTGTSGNTRIHRRPWRLMWRVIARRAASIWRAVIRSGSSALRPYEPKISEVQPLASPLIRPLKASRKLVFLGCRIVPYPRGADAGGLSLHHQPVLRHRIVGEDLTLEDPALDADHAVGGQRLGLGIVDVGAQRVQRHATLAIPLDAGDLGAAETAAASDPDTLGAEPQGRLHRTLHRPAERHAANELVGDTLGDELGVDLRLADLDDVELDLALG